MWRAGCDGAGSSRLPADDARAGFTLIEMLGVMMVASLVIGAISVAFRAPSPGTQLKTLAHVTASRLRDLRASAMVTRAEQVATIDTAGRVIGFGDARGPLALQRGVAVSVTSADDEMTMPARANIRFYPNGSSSGATIEFHSGGQGYEVRVNWLTGRVSTAALR
jgi:general secretion pathway protein H